METGPSRYSTTVVALCGALAVIACSACGSSSAASSPCGSPYVTDVYWGGAVGWYGGVDLGYGADYGTWYDPGDTYDPSTDTGGVSGGYDDGSGDGSGWDAPDDGSGDDGSGDTSGGDTSGGDTSGGDTSGGDTSGGDSTASVTHLRIASAPAARAADGCWSCTVGCTTGADPQAAGRQAIGASNVSHDDACRSAVRSLAQWSHQTMHQALHTCQQVETTTNARAPASPSVQRHTPAPRSFTERRAPVSTK